MSGTRDKLSLQQTRIIEINGTSGTSHKNMKESQSRANLNRIFFKKVLHLTSYTARIVLPGFAHKGNQVFEMIA